MTRDELPSRLERMITDLRAVAEKAGVGTLAAIYAGRKDGKDLAQVATRAALDALALSEARAALSGQGWQQRESAPVDGSVFRAYGLSLVHPDFNPWGQVEACFSGEEFIGAVWDGQHDCWNTVPIEFTHWQPFPASPAPPTQEN